MGDKEAYYRTSKSAKSDMLRRAQADLGRLLGNRPLASLILNRHRALSKTHIRILSDYFKVEPGLFLMAE